MILVKTTYRFFLVFGLLSTSFFSFSQERFNVSINTIGTDASKLIKKTADGYEIVNLESDGTNKYSYKRFILDDLGAVIDTFSITLHERIGGAAYFCMGSYFITGWKDSLPGSVAVAKPFISKIGMNNDTLWTLHLRDFPMDAFFNNPVYIGGDKLMVAGSWRDTLLQYKQFLCQLDTNGNEIWRKTYPFGAGDQILNLLAQAPDGGYILSGGTRSWGNGQMDMYVMKTDSAGNFEWHNWWGSPYGESTFCRPLKDRNYLVYSGKHNNQNHFGTFVMKIDSLGNEIWSNYLQFNPYQSDGAEKFIELENGDLVFCGSTVDTTLTRTNGLFFKLNGEGQLLWKREYNLRPYSHYFKDFVQTDDGGFAIIGFLSGDGMGLDQDAWMVKVDSMGCDVPLCYLGEQELGLEVAILKTFPNPASSIATIELVANSDELEIYNVNGQLIQTIHLENQVLSYILNLNAYENGIYILRLTDKVGATIGQAKIVKK